MLFSRRLTKVGFDVSNGDGINAVWLSILFDVMYIDKEVKPTNNTTKVITIKVCRIISKANRGNMPFLFALEFRKNNKFFEGIIAIKKTRKNRN